MKDPDPQTKEYLDKAKEQYVNNSIRSLKTRVDIKPNRERRIREFLDKVGFKAALTRLASHISNNYKRDANDRFKTQITWPTPQQGEAIFREFANKLTYLMRKTADPEEYRGVIHTARSLKHIPPENIVYAAKIVKYTLHRLVGEPPKQLKNDWAKHEGEWNEVV